jgi:predicted CopG family antitoxin
MEIKTICLDNEAYDRLKDEKRECDSFSETIKRITREVADDWQHSIGTYSEEQSDEFVNAVQRGREATNHGLAQRQREVNATTHGDEDGRNDSTNSY